MKSTNTSTSGSCDVLPSHLDSTMTLEMSPQTEKDDEYDPFEHRNVVHPTSTVGSFFHLLKSSLGSGLLAMPAAFKHTGLILGCIGTAIVAIIATHCVHILVSTSRDICRECRVPSLNYTDSCEKVFKYGPTRWRRFSGYVRNFADYAMAGVCLGGTSVYVIFIATSLKDICGIYFPDRQLSVQAFCGILLIPLILITQVRYLKFLVPFSFLSNVCLFITFLITCRYTFVGDPSATEVKLAVGITEWPLFISTAIFAMEGINVVMPIENEMANPGHFLGCPGVLNVTMTFVAALYGVVGLFGYLKYGDAVKAIITFNLPQDEVLSIIARFLVAVAVFFTYCLQMYAPMDIIWIRIKSRVSEKFHNIAQISLRTASVVLTDPSLFYNHDIMIPVFGDGGKSTVLHYSSLSLWENRWEPPVTTMVLAVAIPDLELLIGLVGAIFFSTLGLLIPIMIQTVHKWDRGLGKWSYILWKNLILLIIYFIVLLSGCYSAISQIVEKSRQ